MEVKTSPEGIVFNVYVLPKSSRNHVSGVHGGALKLKITAAPVEGAANKMCIQFLARVLRVAKSRIQIVSGHTSRIKRIRISASGEEASQLQKRIYSLSSG